MERGEYGAVRFSVADRRYYLTARVKDGSMDLAEAQKQIARDWTQLLDAAKGWCATHRCRGEP